MSVSITPGVRPVSGSAGAGWLDRLLARRLVAALSRLEGGSLRVVDPGAGDFSCRSSFRWFRR
jgi:hypothetical protein